MLHFARLTLLLCGLCLLSASPLQARNLPDFTQLVKQHGNVVVNISTTRAARAPGNPALPDDVPPPFRDLFRHFYGPQGRMPERNVRSLGSGMILSSDGYILTNNHVIKGADKVVVRLLDRREFVAKVIGQDKGSDLALLKIKAKGLPKVTFADSDTLQVGEWVLAIGSPFGFEHSVTAGIVSAKRRSLGTNERYVPFIQTDVAINPGNSGGPLFNLKGEVVGINAQIISRSGGYLGLSFAVPSNVAKDVITQLRTKGYVARGWLGVSFQEVSRRLAESFGLASTDGALITRVFVGSPADKAGLRPGDVVLTFNQHQVKSALELPPLVGALKAGDTVVLQIVRQRKTFTKRVVIGEMPGQVQVKPVTRSMAKRTDGNRLGVRVRDLAPHERQALGVQMQGVVVTALRSGPAQQGGLMVGDVIISLDLESVSDAKSFAQIVARLPANKSVPVLVSRKGNAHYLSIKLGR